MFRYDCGQGFYLKVTLIKTMYNLAVVALNEVVQRTYRRTYTL